MKEVEIRMTGAPTFRYKNASAHYEDGYFLVFEEDGFHTAFSAGEVEQCRTIVRDEGILSGIRLDEDGTRTLEVSGVQCTELKLGDWVTIKGRRDDR